MHASRDWHKLGFDGGLHANRFFHHLMKIAWQFTFAGLLPLVCLLAQMSPAHSEEAQFEILGSPQSPKVNLYVPKSPLGLNSQNKLTPNTRRWLTHVADTAGVHFVVFPATFQRSWAELARSDNSCSLGVARLPDREAQGRWLSVIWRDHLVVIARKEDTIDGDFQTIMKAADGNILVPNGIYRAILQEYAIREAGMVDHRSVARMVVSRRARFGFLSKGNLQLSDASLQDLRIVAEVPPVSFWIVCSPTMPDALAKPMQAAFDSEAAQVLNKLVGVDSQPDTVQDPAAIPPAL